MQPTLSRRKLLLGSIGLGAVMASSLATSSLATWSLSGQPREPHANHSRLHRKTSHALGSKVAIGVIHDDSQHATAAIDAAFATIERVEQSLSIYRPDSEISRLNRAGKLDAPSAMLVDILQQSQAVSSTTQGAFDISVQPLWNYYAAKHHLQTTGPSDLQTARQLVDYRKINIQSDCITFQDPGMQITFNGIAQGYATDQAFETLKEWGIEHALIDAGEIRPLGTKNDSQDWQVGIANPLKSGAPMLVELQGRSLSTSGDYATRFSPHSTDHHLLDPHTGCSPQILTSCSVAAPDCTLADAWSTACFVLGPVRSMKLLASRPGIDAYFTLRDGTTLATPGFPLISEVRS